MLGIISTFSAITEPKFNCATCLKSTSKEFRERTKACNAGGTKVIAKYHTFLNYYRCPGGFRGESYVELIRLNRLWENGVLPYEGGILDQPAKYIEAMKLIDGLRLEHQKDVEAKQARWQRTRSQSNSQSSKPRR